MYVVGATYDRPLAWAAEHLGGHQLHNKGAEIAVREWLRIQEPIEHRRPISAAAELPPCASAKVTVESPCAKVTQMHHADKQRYCGAMITAPNLGMSSGVSVTTVMDAECCTSTHTTKEAYNPVMENSD